MSPRYYWISALIVIGLTFAIWLTTERKLGKELTIIFIQVACGLILLAGLVSGLAKLLVILGIAEEGFVL